MQALCYNAGMQNAEFAIGTKVYTPYPSQLRALDPKLDTGRIVRFEAPFTHVWVEKSGPSGKFRTPYPVHSVEVIG